MVTQQQVETFLSDIRSQHSAVASVFSDVDDLELQAHETGQVELILRNPTKPGMADGTAGTPQAPETATTADENANAETAQQIGTQLRELGADVDQFVRSGGIEIFATFDP